MYHCQRRTRAGTLTDPDLVGLLPDIHCVYALRGESDQSIEVVRFTDGNRHVHDGLAG